MSGLWGNMHTWTARDIMYATNMGKEVMLVPLDRHQGAAFHLAPVRSAASIFWSRFGAGSLRRTMSLLLGALRKLCFENFSDFAITIL